MATVPGGVQLDISWAGRSAADYARVFATTAAISDFSEVLRDIGQEVVAPSIKTNFDQGGRPGWEPLAEATVAKKSRQGVSNPSKILVHTGALESAATTPSNYQVTKEMLRAAPFGAAYWIYHQEGTSHVPQRVIMMLQAADRSKVTRLFADFIRKHMVFQGVGARPFVGTGG